MACIVSLFPNISIESVENILDNNNIEYIEELHTDDFLNFAKSKAFDDADNGVYVTSSDMNVRNLLIDNKIPFIFIRPNKGACKKFISDYEKKFGTLWKDAARCDNDHDAWKLYCDDKKESEFQTIMYVELLYDDIIE